MVISACDRAQMRCDARWQRRRPCAGSKEQVGTSGEPAGAGGDGAQGSGRPESTADTAAGLQLTGHTQQRGRQSTSAANPALTAAANATALVVA
jgi:hypothetical protein